MQEKKLKNKSSQNINIPTLGIELPPGASCDIQALSFEQIKSFLISDEREENLLSSLVFEIDDHSYSGIEIQEAYSITEKGNNNVAWKSLFLENLTTFEEIACSKVISTCFQENIPVLGIGRILDRLPIILDDGYRESHNETLIDITKGNHTYCLSPSEQILKKPLDKIYTWQETGRRNKGSYQINNFCVYKTPSHLQITTNNQNTQKYYGLRGNFASPVDLSSYSALSLDIFGVKGITLTIVGKRYGNQEDIWAQDLILEDGWTEYLLDLKEIIKTGLAYIEFRFYNVGRVSLAELLIDTPALVQITNNAYKKYGRLETYTKKTISPVQEIFLNIVHTCEDEEQCQLSCFFSLDDGAHWEKIESANYKQWINVKDTSPWNNRQAIKLAIEIHGDSTNTALVHGYYLIYRTGEN